MRQIRLFLTLAAITAAGCAPGVSGDDHDGSSLTAADGGYGGPVGAVAGTVWAPGNAPGMVATGQELPISGALVYVSYSRPDPIPQMAYCEQCVEVPYA